MVVVEMNDRREQGGLRLEEPPPVARPMSRNDNIRDDSPSEKDVETGICSFASSSSDLKSIEVLPKGWRPYCALLAGFCGMANCWGIIMSYGTFFRFYKEHLLLGTSDSSVGIIGGIVAFLVLFLSVFVGRLADAQYHRYLLGFGGVMTTLGYFCLSFAGGDGHDKQGNYGLIFLTQGLIAGVGMACYFMHSSYLSIQSFPRLRYLAIGITSAGATTGGVVYPIAISFLLQKYGFPKGVRILSVIIAGFSTVAFVFGGPPRHGKKTPLKNAHKIGCWFKYEAFRCTPYALFTAAMASVFFGYTPLMFHITVWAEQDQIRMVWFLVILNGCAVGGRLASATLATLGWLSPLLIQAFFTALASILVFCFWPLAHNQNDAIGFCVSLGICLGVIIGIPASCIAHIIPPEQMGYLGAWTGLMWSSCSLFALAGPPIAGYCVKKFGIVAVGYWTGINFALASTLVVLAMVMNRKRDMSRVVQVRSEDGRMEKPEMTQ